jgi:transcriptional regulator with GAF, ATPase, and Fis domain
MAGVHELRLIKDGAPVIDESAAIRLTLKGILPNRRRSKAKEADDEQLVLSVRKGTRARELRLRSFQLRRELEKAVGCLLGVGLDEELALSIWCSVIEPFTPGTSAGADGGVDRESGQPLRERVERFERTIIAKEFEAARRNQSETARRLGVSRPALIAKLQKYGFQRA